MSGWKELWHTHSFGNELGDWALALIVFLAPFTVLPLIARFLRAQQHRASTQRSPHVQNALDLAATLIERTSRLFLLGLALWLASRGLNLAPGVEHWFTVALVILFWMQMAQWAMTAVRFGLEHRQLLGRGQDTLLKSSVQIILFAARVIVWGVAALLALSNLGVKIEPLLAGLGIGGIAIALAVQTVLADLLASVSIALDQPFAVGDSLGVDDFQGTVEHIGVKSTRLRSVNGEQIIMANTDILKARVRNYGRQQERRALFRLTVDYGTPVATLAAVPRAVREIIEATPDTRFGRCHLLNFADAGLQFEVVYFLTRPEFAVYGDAQQRITLRILERFSAMGVSFAAAMPSTVRLQFPQNAATEAGGQQPLL